jgi:potassium/hydrogen antiporter
MPGIDTILIISALMLIASILTSRISDRLGIPALLLFLLLGMLAGSEGIGGIYFDDPGLTQFIAVVALALILFSGGLDTRIHDIRPVLKEGIALSTLGVFLTAVLVGLFAHWVLGFTLQTGLLLGAVVSSTDAAAVLSVLRSKNVSLKSRLRPLLELESGSNDPMAVFLTITFIQMILEPQVASGVYVVRFVLQMVVGAMVGYGMGRAIPVVINRIRLGYDGLYPGVTLGLALLTYGMTNELGGNGFLAVYVAGIVAGNSIFVHKRSLLQFHDGLAWLMQIGLFLSLGLLVFPSELAAVALDGLAVVLFLMLVARPLTIFICLLPTTYSLREKILLGWVGLRGAVPIVLATYALTAGLPKADLIFNLVFFVVFISVLVQGTTITRVAQWLGLHAPLRIRRIHPLEYQPMAGMRSELRELVMPKGSAVSGKAIFELSIPDGALIILVRREDEYFVPNGQTILQEKDTLLVLAEPEEHEQVIEVVCALDDEQT